VIFLEALNRTLLLMRDDIGDQVSNEELMLALTRTSVVLVADEKNIATHSAQCAFVTAAMLMARSGHRVHLIAPDIPFTGFQPPLPAGSIVSELLHFSEELMPGYSFGHADYPDLAILFGDSPWAGRASRILRLNAGPWHGRILGSDSHSAWAASEWPFGGLAAATLGAAEAFKVAMTKLRQHARNSELYMEFCRSAENVSLELAPATSPQTASLGNFDIISAGAITNAVLYTLARIQNVTGTARVMDEDSSAISNLNRYMLLFTSCLDRQKATALATLPLGGLVVQPVVGRFSSATNSAILPLAPAVMVGVDHIPTRWEIQKANPKWLGIGATTHWSAMASFHSPGLACARCLHPVDDINDAPIPTVAFVSFWAGLLLATYFVRHIAGEHLSPMHQQIFFCPLRPETPWWSPVARRAECLVCNATSHQTVRGSAPV
jgi:hypothetical protein